MKKILIIFRPEWSQEAKLYARKHFDCSFPIFSVEYIPLHMQSQTFYQNLTLFLDQGFEAHLIRKAGEDGCNISSADGCYENELLLLFRKFKEQTYLGYVSKQEITDASFLTRKHEDNVNQLATAFLFGHLSLISYQKVRSSCSYPERNLVPLDLYCNSFSAEEVITLQTAHSKSDFTLEQKKFYIKVKRIWDKTEGSNLNKAKTLLNDYTQGNPWLKLFFTCHLGRNHVAEVAKIYNTANDFDQLLEELNKIKIKNPAGTLAVIIRFLTISKHQIIIEENYQRNF